MCSIRSPGRTVLTLGPALFALVFGAPASGAPTSVSTSVPGAQAHPTPQTSGTLASDVRTDEASQGLGASSTGDLELNVPFELPAFRGLEPKIGLLYSSARSTGFAGAGWELSGFSVIERASPRLAAPSYDSTDIFRLDGSRLIACGAATTGPSCTTGGDFATEVESFTKVLRNTAANTWTVIAKNGARHTYRPIYTTALGTFRWGISDSIDLHGNRVDFTWVSDPGKAVYPESIRYNHTVVSVYLEPRPDPLTFVTGGAALGVIDSRLKTVDIVVNGERARTYRLLYDRHEAVSTFPAGAGAGLRSTLLHPQEDALRSRLYAVRRYGRDAVLNAAGTVTAGTVDPSEVAYRYGAPADALVTSNAANPGGISYPSHTRSETHPGINSCELSGTATQFSGDFDGDGIIDVGCFDPFDTLGRPVLQRARMLLRKSYDLVAGVPDPSQSASWLLPRPGWCASGRIVAADYNNDKKMDLICRGGGEADEVAFSLGTDFRPGSGNDVPAPSQIACFPLGLGQFRQASSPQPICGTGNHILAIRITDQIRFVAAFSNHAASFASAANTLWGDYDGDGLDDLAVVSAAGGVSVFHSSTLHNLPPRAGSTLTFVDFDPPSVGLANGFCNPLKLFVGDVNGDGLGDLYCDVPSNGGAVAISNGRGAFLRQPGAFAHGTVNGTSSTLIGLADVDGDGRSDLVSHSPRTDGAHTIWVGLSDGLSARPAAIWTAAGARPARFTSGSESLSFGDFNHDGRLDVLTSQQGNTTTGEQVHFEMADALERDRITEIDSPGKVVRITYASSGQLEVGDMPFRSLVVSISAPDKLTEYGYSGAVYDRNRRTFRGFSRITERTHLIGEAAASDTLKTTTFRLDPGFPGRPSHVEVKLVTSGALRSTADLSYLPDPIAPFASLLSRRVERDYVAGSFRETRTDFLYDSYGNTTRTTFFGDTSLTGDPRARSSPLEAILTIPGSIWSTGRPRRPSMEA